MEKGQKKPYYGKRTKNRILKEYLDTSASMDELSELHGVLGSNTISDWLKKYGNSGNDEFSKSAVMKKPHAPNPEKEHRKKRFKLDVHLRISELEADLDKARSRMEFYRCAMDIVNELAEELTGIDLLKKTGQELSTRSVRRES